MSSVLVPDTVTEGIACLVCFDKEPGVEFSELCFFEFHLGLKRPVTCGELASHPGMNGIIEVDPSARFFISSDVDPDTENDI